VLGIHQSVRTHPDPPVREELFQPGRFAHGIRAQELQETLSLAEVLLDFLQLRFGQFRTGPRDDQQVAVLRYLVGPDEQNGMRLHIVLQQEPGEFNVAVQRIGVVDSVFAVSLEEASL
jgi:hypothetical protein